MTADIAKENDLGLYRLTYDFETEGACVLRRKYERAGGLEYDVNGDCAIVQCMQGWAKWWTLSFEKFAPAVACHFCLALPAAFTQTRSSPVN